MALLSTVHSAVGGVQVSDMASCTLTLLIYVQITNFLRLGSLRSAQDEENVYTGPHIRVRWDCPKCKGSLMATASEASNSFTYTPWRGRAYSFTISRLRARIDTISCLTVSHGR
jgi:hypothetical protein